MNRSFSEKALLQIRSEIDETGGNEVFFLGHTDEAKVVIDVEPLARGSRDAVAAILVAASFGDVVIHNHPSGNLTPSRPDLEIAGILGNQGVGFYIIDNGATRCYQAVSPFVRFRTEQLSYPEIEQWYAPNGVLSSHLDEYEFRQEQTRMAFAVAEAFNEDKVAVIEAGTGTGKSLAYLFPAVLWAVRNRERVVISTNTINLQEQLTKKDIPFLRKYCGHEFRAVLVKGRHNYLCKRKIESLKSDPLLFKDESAADLEAIVTWSRSSTDGCRSDLSFIPREDAWEEVCCEADQCNRVRCHHYSGCFFYSARREAAGADLLVVNHALLMSDVAIKQETGYSSMAILPPFERLIFDEGHHLEDVATGHLSTQTSRSGLLRLIGKLQHPRKPQKGLLPQLSAGLSREVPEHLDNLYLEAAGVLEGRLIPETARIAEDISRSMDAIGVALLAHLKNANNMRGDLKLRMTDATYTTRFWLEVEERIRSLVSRLNGYTETIAVFLKVCGTLPENVRDKLSGNLIDLKGLKGRLEGVLENLVFFVSRNDGFCHWFEVGKSGKGPVVKLCSSPLQVAESIKAVILEKFKSVVITSATLAVAEKFDYLERQTGISLLPRSRVTELLLPSPFDYRSQSFVGIPADIPEPAANGYESALAEVLADGLKISQGRAFVLFTSYELLGRVYNRLAKPLAEAGLTTLRQGEFNRHLLLSRFRKERNPVLFGTDSFWEGVDVKGKALELVVITRLPFRVPTEPILEARAEHISASGGDPFMEYTIPQAVIKFKQGFGRLIRSRDDRGAVLILDSRVLSKNYGKAFLGSLPGAPVMKGTSEEVLAGMADFFTLSPS